MADEGRKISQFPDASSLTDSDLIPIVQSNTNKKITGKKIKTFLQESGEFAPTNSPNFTGSPTAETQSKGDNSNKLATTAFVQQNKTTITQATEENLGGIRAKAKTDETVEAAIDPSTGKIYVPTYPTGGGGEGSVDITDVQVTVDQNTGVPSATGSFEEGVLKLDFKNLKGADAKTPDITINATVDDNTGTPSVEVSKSGGVENPSFSFAFKNLKGKNGEKGLKGDTGQGVPAGGTAGQVLKKKSGTDYDTEWADDNTGSGGGSGGDSGLSVRYDAETQNIVFEKADSSISYTVLETTLPLEQVDVPGEGKSIDIDANKVYVFETVTYLSIGINRSSIQPGYANEYHFFFTSGSTPTTLYIPGEWIVDAYSIEANTTYEVSVMNNVCYIRGTKNEQA